MIQGSLLFSVHLYLLLSHTLGVSLLPSRRFNALYAAPPPSSEGGKAALRAAAAEILALIDSLRNHGAADLLESGDVCARFKVITKTIFLSSPDAASFCSIPRARRGEYFLFNFSRFPAQSWHCRPSRIRRCSPPLQGHNQDRIPRQP